MIKKLKKAAKKQQRKPSSRPLQVDLVVGIISLLLITGTAMLYFNFKHNSKAILALSKDLIMQINETVVERTSRQMISTVITDQIISTVKKENVLALGKKSAHETLLLKVLSTYPDLHTLSITNKKGEMLIVQRQTDNTTTSRFIFPKGHKIVSRKADGTLIKSQPLALIKKDPRKEVWYRMAIKNQSRSVSDIYQFLPDDSPGIVVSYPINDKKGNSVGVFSYTINLPTITSILDDQKIAKNGIALVTNRWDNVVGYRDPGAPKTDETFKRRHISHLGIPQITAAFTEYAATQEQFVFFTLNNEKFIGSFTSFPNKYIDKWKMVIVAPESDFVGSITGLNRDTYLVSAVVLLFGILFSIYLSRSISKPIEFLTQETERIKNFFLDSSEEIKSPIKEIQTMNNSIKNMKIGLRSFKKYVPAELVRLLISEGMEANLGGEKKQLTMLFSDIKGFTSISEKMDPEALINHLSEYLHELANIIREERGTVDKFIGDAMMVFWGAPIDDEEHAYHGCLAALRCQKRLNELNEQWEKEGKVPLPTRIGLNSGETVVGNMGSTSRMNYTVLGDSVNLASRLEAINSQYMTDIIIGEETHKHVHDRFLCRQLDIVAVKGKVKGVKIFELVCTLDDPKYEQHKTFVTSFESAVKLYLNRQFKEAIAAFEPLKVNERETFIADKYIQRCQSFIDTPPDDDWTGVFKMTTK